jgi:hypothetical protein
MKFVNFTNASRPRHERSEHPDGRKGKRPAVPAPLPAPRNLNQELKDLLKAMKPEPKGVFESKMLRASQTLTTDQIKQETEDILSVLRNLHTK